MARLLGNFTDAAHQRHTILFSEFEIIFTIRFFPLIQMWSFDCEYKDFNVYGQKLSCGTTHIKELNQPFDFVVTDNQQAGLDPMFADDFSSGRCSIYLLEPEDMRDIRNGVEVEL
jgi:hypothetical protein